VKALNKSKGINTSWQTNKAETENRSNRDRRSKWFGIAKGNGNGNGNGNGYARDTRQQKPSKFLHRTFIFGCLSLHTLISEFEFEFEFEALAQTAPHTHKHKHTHTHILQGTRDAINLKKVNC